MKSIAQTKNLSFIQRIALFFSMKVLVDNKLTRRAMAQFFHSNEWGYETTITDVRTFLSDEGLTVEITTHRPGILIGKAGHFIDSLKKHLSEELSANVTIDLKESKLWHNLYS